MLDEEKKKRYLAIMGYQVKDRRKALNMTQEELAAKLGYTSKSSINKIELGKSGIPQRRMKDFAKALHTSVSYLMDGMEDEPEREQPDTKSNLVPLLGLVSCGEPIYTNQEYSFVSSDLKADFCLKAQGDSMTGSRIMDGDIVFCRLQEQVENGQIACVLIGDSATLKHFYYYPERELVILKASNPAYPDQIYSGIELDGLRILGKAVGFQSEIK